MLEEMEEIEKVTSASQKHAVLTLVVADQEYGMYVADVVQIIEMVTITHLPQLPISVKGVINYRGNIVPIMDLRTRFDIPFKPYGAHTPIVLVDFNGRTLGLVVDAVEEVLDIDEADIDASNDIITPDLMRIDSTPSEKSYLSGLARVERRIIPIVQAGALLTHFEKAQLAQAISEN